MSMHRAPLYLNYNFQSHLNSQILRIYHRYTCAIFNQYDCYNFINYITL